MKEFILPPDAKTLINSMRAVGYSFEAAIADIIDNSIAAGASNIHIRFSPYRSAYVAVIDDGLGMDGSELTQAMRHGSRNPDEIRSDTDLGRFGLGLKTASLSQCRKLTVISRKNGIDSSRRWDLDFIEERKDWALLVLDKKDLEVYPVLPEIGDKGTAVIWEDFDRVSAGESSLERCLCDALDRTRDHLALVFHRYLAGEPGFRKVAMSINGNCIEPFDPFMTWQSATQRLQVEKIKVDEEYIIVEPFILPHQSKLKKVEIEKAGGKEGMLRHQGFYVYRNRRLIIWGTWFRLAKQEELTKLARVKVDIPNSLDHLWEVDIKKSVAYPPEAVRQNLRRIIARIFESSRRVYTYRGRISHADNLIHAWNRVVDRDGIAYSVNRSHPAINELRDSLNDQQTSLLDGLLRTLEISFPAEAFYADMAGDQRNMKQGIDTPEELLELARILLSTAGSSEAAEKLLSSLKFIEPFCHYPEIFDKLPALLKEKDNAD
jgi:hypothetical protein